MAHQVPSLYLRGDASTFCFSKSTILVYFHQVAELLGLGSHNYPNSLVLGLSVQHFHTLAWLQPWQVCLLTIFKDLLCASLSHLGSSAVQHAVL